MADHRTNVDDVWNIDAKIQERFTGGGIFGDVTMKKKKDQAHTVSITRNPIKIDGEDVRMSPVELYHRPLCIAIPNGPHDPGICSYEMTAVVPALFNDDGSMIIDQKSHLAKHILRKDHNITRKQHDNYTGRKYDCCTLIRRLDWPKVGTVWHQRSFILNTTVECE